VNYFTKTSSLTSVMTSIFIFEAGGRKNIYFLLCKFFKVCWTEGFDRELGGLSIWFIADFNDIFLKLFTIFWWNYFFDN